MARKAEYDRDQVIADWKTGKYSVRKLAAKHRVSAGTIHSIVAGIAKDTLLANRNTEHYCDKAKSVYLITSQEFKSLGLFKIGITNNLEKRIATLQTACPFILYAHAVANVENPLAIEVALHSFFERKKTIGEWFKLADEDVRYIEESFLHLNQK